MLWEPRYWDGDGLSTHAMLMVTVIQIDILFGGLHRCAIKE